MDLRKMFGEGGLDPPWEPPDDIDKTFAEIRLRREKAKKKKQEEHQKNNFHWPEDSDTAVEVWKQGLMTFCVTFNDKSEELKGIPEELRSGPIGIQVAWHCGYVRFPHNPFVEHKGYDGILTYVPVHGGLTYAEEDWDGSMVYGFDCNHGGDGRKAELQCRVWLKEHCEMMGKAIIICSWYESKYLNAKTDEARAAVVDEMNIEIYKKVGLPFDLTNNFGAMIDTLFGGPKKADDERADREKKFKKYKEDNE